MKFLAVLAFFAATIAHADVNEFRGRYTPSRNCEDSSYAGARVYISIGRGWSGSNSRALEISAYSPGEAYGDSIPLGQGSSKGSFGKQTTTWETTVEGNTLASTITRDTQGTPSSTVYLLTRTGNGTRIHFRKTETYRNSTQVETCTFVRVRE